jgi:hypothetical protein
MKRLGIGLLALSAVAVAAVTASPVPAQAAKLKREAAIQKCVAYARTVPEGKGVDNQRAAVGMFKDCMKNEGHRP